ncbi:MAG: AMP-dependent synthetase, partial [Acidobacteriota bacterium]
EAGVSARLEQFGAIGRDQVRQASVARALSLALETLEARCREAVLAAAGLRIEAVYVLEPGTLPRTSSGKLRRAETLHRHRAGELSPPDAVNALGLLGAMARSTLAHVSAGRRQRLERDG